MIGYVIPRIIHVYDNTMPCMKCFCTTESLSAVGQSERCLNQTKPRDCDDVRRLGSTLSGTYVVYTGSTLRPLSVFCDMMTDNSGWTVIFLCCRSQIFKKTRFKFNPRISKQIQRRCLRRKYTSKFCLRHRIIKNLVHRLKGVLEIYCTA